MSDQPEQTPRPRRKGGRKPIQFESHVTLVPVPLTPEATPAYNEAWRILGKMAWDIVRQIRAEKAAAAAEQEVSHD
jgi:hypothetical protein